ncbi:MAG: hypothetical protein SVV80_03045 [Planctomycetota bacterium]|nr:hypothetical protein [Planctomycetota bacterium]
MQIYVHTPDHGRDPYGRDPYGRDPYGRDPYGRDPYGRDQYGRDTRATNDNATAFLKSVKDLSEADARSPAIAMAGLGADERLNNSN